MLKTRKRWVSLLVAVVMVAGLLIPFVGTANALATYSITSVNNITAGSGTPQPCGTTEATFDVPTWSSITPGGTTSYVYASLPSSPTGFAYYIGSDVAPYTPAISPTSPSITSTALGLTNAVIGATGAVITLTGANWTTVYGGATGAEYPQTLNIAITDPGTLSSPLPTSVTVDLPLSIWVPSGVTGGVTQTLEAPSGSVWSSGSGTIAMVGNATLTVAVESTPAISTAGGSVGIIDVTENAAGALNSGGSPGLKLTLPPGFTWEAPTNGAPTVEYMWGAWGTGNDSASNIYTAMTANAGRELDLGNAPSIAG